MYIVLYITTKKLRKQTLAHVSGLGICIKMTMKFEVLQNLSFVVSLNMEKFLFWKNEYNNRSFSMFIIKYTFQLINSITSYVVAPFIPQTLLCPKSPFPCSSLFQKCQGDFPRSPQLEATWPHTMLRELWGGLFARQRMIYKSTDLERAAAGQDLSPLPFWWWMSGELSKSEHRVTSPENVN